jgi:thiol-disulfide isomerase/thioredoxin
MAIHKHLGVLLMSALLATSNAFAIPAVGDLAPDEFGKTINGDTPKLADYAGKVVVLSFWASWCGYCLKELPVLEGIQKAGKGNVQVIAVNQQSRNEFKEIERSLRVLTMKLTYDPEKKGGTAYGVKGIPHLVIIGRDGKIIEVHRGYGESSLPKILDAINLALATPVPATSSSQ